MQVPKKVLKVLAKCIICVLVITVLFLPAWFINDIYGYLPGVFICSIILVSEVSFLIIRHRITVEVDTHDAVCYRGEKVGVSIRVKNNSLLICPKAIVTLYISDLFGGEDNETTTVFTMNSRDETVFSFDITMDHIGVYSAGVKELLIYDFLDLFSSRLQVNTKFTVTVLPNVVAFDQSGLRDQLLSENINSYSSMENDGWDYTGVREYVLGDSMKRIHWKLSAHSNGYMTKITETCQKCDVGVVLDLFSEKYEKEQLMEINDALIESSLSCIESIMHRGMDYSLIYQDKNKELIRAIPKGDDDYQTLVSSFPVIRTLDDKGTLNACNILDSEGKNANRSTNVIVFTSKLSEELVTEVISIKRQKRNPILYYITPKILSKNELGKALAFLRPLDSYAIAYYHVTTGGVNLLDD